MQMRVACQNSEPSSGSSLESAESVPHLILSAVLSLMVIEVIIGVNELLKFFQNLLPDSHFLSPLFPVFCFRKVLHYLLTYWDFGEASFFKRKI